MARDRGRRPIALHVAGPDPVSRTALAYNPRMKIVLNGESREVTATTSLAQLLEQSGYGTRRVAVEVNREIVPRSRHAERGLVEGDRVEIVHAIGGG